MIRLYVTNVIANEVRQSHKEKCIKKDCVTQLKLENGDMVPFEIYEKIDF